MTFENSVKNIMVNIQNKMFQFEQTHPILFPITGVLLGTIIYLILVVDW